ncbi:methyltransferase-like protein 24 isoform X1 [Oryzias latipes]|uniref:methyltransferase-like protein 24 isoform X1 n=1 Tax=Oryzias latipes TaxID=8090 RepID=UPI0009DB5251|nr:methyltransferase-like protein 24 isoform X1 [Oryzias latipes]
MWGLGGSPLRPRILLLSIPPFLLALQLLIIGSRLPRAARARSRPQDQDGAVAFSVLSIEPERSERRRGTAVREEVREDLRDAGRVYVDENEMHERQIGPGELEVQLWAAATPSFTAEVNRIVTYINTPQLNCSKVLSPERTLASSSRWMLCAEEWLLPAADRLCVAYSFSMDGGDKDFLETVSRLGCEIHCFDPSNSNASGGCHGNSLASNCGDRGRVSKHKMWLEWRAQKRRGRKARGDLGRASRTLANIMAALGHHTVRGAPALKQAHSHTGEEEKFRENTAKQTYHGVFYPSILRKLFYFDVAIATGLCAISGCYSNSFRESRMGSNFVLQPQEGVRHLQFKKESSEDVVMLACLFIVLFIYALVYI